MPVLKIGEMELEYSLERSATANKASITVTPDAIVATVPETATDEQIGAVLHRRRSRLIEQRRTMAAKQSA